MPELLLDALGNPVPQYLNDAGTAYEAVKGSANAIDVNIESIDAGVELELQGDNPHDAVDAGNPVKIGGKGTAAVAANVTEGDRVNGSFDQAGRLRILIDLAMAVAAAAIPAQGMMMGGSDGTLLRFLKVDATGNLLLGANSGVDVGDVDVLSVVPGTAATNLGKAVDSVAGATDTGVTPLAVRADALGALTPIAGDYVPMRVDANGALWTHDDALDAALAGSEIQVDVVAPLPAGTNAIGKLAANSGVDIGDIDILSTPYDATLGAAPPAVGALAAGTDGAATRALKLSAAGNILLGANSGVDIGDVDITSVVPGTAAASLGKAVDAVAGAADTGVAPLAVRDDALGALAPIEGDYVPLRTDANGALWTHDDALDAALAGSELQVDIVASIPAGANNIGDVDVLTLPGVAGDTAHDAADAGNPLKVGGKATSNTPPPVSADNDRVNASFDRQGIQRMAIEGRFVELLASGARGATAGTDGTTFGDLARFGYAFITLDVTAAATDVDDTLDVYIDTSPDGGVTWVNAVHFTPILGNGGAKRKHFIISVKGATGVADFDGSANQAAGAGIHALGNAMRARWIIVDPGAGAASFTFGITANMKQ